jgi:large subunit ribosomal protein L22
MEYKAKAKYVHYSPYKLRPIANVIRGKDVTYAIDWLTIYKVKRAEPILKTLKSAVANANDLNKLSPQELVVKEIRIDHGPMIKYFKPGAMGRSNPYRKRMSHISIIVDVAKTKSQQEKN